MLGQVATLRAGLTDVATLHREVTDGAAALLAGRFAEPEVLLQPELGVPADIAIVGIASVLPKSAHTRQFWENIIARVDAITEIPSHRWDWRLYFDADRTVKDRIYSKWGGFLDDLPFDPTRYGMPPKSITSVDPMQLMGLEVAQRTLADAGYADRPFDREKASVIVGASGGAGDYGLQYGLRSEIPRFVGELAPEVAERLPEWTEDSFAGILPNVVAGRIANRLNFGGINVAVDAACASSLAAVYQGVNELTAGRSDFVIAGGVDTVQGPFGYLCFSKTQALSPRGRCSTFDADGDGIVISEGIAMVAMKRLADAQRDGDRIYAVIKGVGASSDGNAKGLTAPLPAGQLRAMRRAYAMAGYGPASVGLFEAHGTGTVAGDTAELESTMRLMREEGVAPRHAVIGSVKTNIGHTKASAGVAGMIKAILSLHHRVLPPHRNVKTPNRVLADPSAPLYLVDEATPWLEPGDVPRRASCSAFGFGGTNFHIAMEEYAGEYREWLKPVAANGWSAELLLWSAADAASLESRLSALAGKLAALESADGLLLRDLAASLASQWRPRGHTLAIVAKDMADLRAKLGVAAAFLRGEAKALVPGIFHGTASAPAGKVAVLFPGQGSQYPGMAREAALHFESVASTLSAADAALREAFGTRFGASARLSQFVFPRGAYDDEAKAQSRQALTSTDVAQPALGAVEAGLYRLMSGLGLQADMLAGHSYGEFVALFAAGAISFESLMELSAARGRFIVDAAKAEGAQLGTMAAVNAPRKIVEDAIADIDEVIIANHNAPLQSIVSGTREAVKAASEKLAQAGVEVTEIPVAAAFHSSLVKPAQAPLSELIEATPWAPAQIPVYSNTTARAHAADVARVKRQMAEHLVRPVEFAAEIEEMYKDGARVFVEVGPKAVLSRLASRILEGQPHVAIAIDDGSGLGGLLGGIAQMLCAGLPLDIAQLFARRDCRVGDPAEPAALVRVEALSKHAWMLNGSGARRAGEPVRQVGVTLEQAEARAAAQAAAPVVATVSPPAPIIAPAVVPAAPAPVVQRIAPTSPQPAWRKATPMDDRRPAPGLADPSVMSEYFLTMRQFLETQERVMASFLGDGSAVRAATPVRSRPVTMAMPRVAEVPALPAVPVAAPAPVVAAPVAAKPAAAVAAPAPAPVAAKPAEPAKPAAAPAPAKAAAPAGEGLTREKVTDMLLAIVEEKTGYPRDMVGLHQNLEADLGIDSIKRIEVVGAMLQQLPAAHRDALTEHRSKLNTQSTLNGMIDLIAQAKVGGGVAVPFDVAEAGSPADEKPLVAHPSRHVMAGAPEAIAAGAWKDVGTGHLVVTRDRLGVAESLVQQLEASGCTVTLLGEEVLADEAALLAWTAEFKSRQPTLAGVVHLAPVGAEWLPVEAPIEAFRRQLQVHEKALFLLVRELGAAFADSAHVVAASALGGRFNRDGSAGQGLALQSGALGMLKSLQEEKPSWRLKGIDLDPSQPAAALSAQLFGEMALQGGRQEVGYPGGERTVFRTVEAAVAPAAVDARNLNDIVVLATGGARGITAEVLRELARPGNTLVLTGRSALPEAEPEAIAALADAASLQRHFIAEVRSGNSSLKPAEIARKVQGILGMREMRANLDDFRAAGATVEYHAVDVTREAEVAALVQGLYARHGRIDGVVHGAGVIEDKLLADKASDSWSRVVDTKVIGLLLLQKHLVPQSLKFLCVFSSVAGRYGNSGQSDYATANELMNRLCAQLRDRWQHKVNVNALCWGPWGATKFGAGMVTAETEAKFAEKGVHLVSAALGRQLFRDEIAREGGNAPIEVICGAGPWESTEADKGALRAQPLPQGPALGPLLGNGAATSRPTGERIVPVRLDPSRHLYLHDHVFDGKMVLPAAAALGLMAEAANALWPGWQVVEVREHKLLKGVDLDGTPRDLQVFLSPPPYGSSEGFEVSAQLQSDLGNGRAMTHYRCTIRLEQALPVALPHARTTHNEKSLAPRQAYEQWLSHGPRLQMIEQIEGLSENGSRALVRASHPSHWMADQSSDQPGWLFDPALLDAAAQMAWVWSRAYRDETALPTRFGRVVRYRAGTPERLHMEYERVATTDPTLVRGNFIFVDDAGEPVLMIEELDSIASAALNRLGGSVRAAEDAAA